MNVFSRFARFVLPVRVKTWLAGIVYSNFYERTFGFGGQLTSVNRFQRQRIDHYFQHREKSECALVAATGWYGGDYMEFGACGLFTFRNMLTAFDLCGLAGRFPDTRFYAFDVFGKLDSADAETRRVMGDLEARTRYFSQQFPGGDELERHREMIERHRLFVPQCRLVQGYFQDTLTADFAHDYRPREIGFAFIDCNYVEQYKVVFEFIFGLMSQNSYVYMDEYYQAAGVAAYFDEFSRELKAKRSIETRFVRNAGAFGALFCLRPLADPAPLKI